MKEIYLVHHAEAVGDYANARLTENGLVQSKVLSQLLQREHSCYKVVCSPALRSRETVHHLCETLNIEPIIDFRLKERILTTSPIMNWKHVLQQSFVDMTTSFYGGESSNDAQERGLELITEILQDYTTPIVIVTHSNLFTLLLRYFNKTADYITWSYTSKPDVYKICIDDHIRVEHLWKQSLSV